MLHVEHDCICIYDNKVDFDKSARNSAARFKYICLTLTYIEYISQGNLCELSLLLRL